jgi:hypothetical protein
MIDTKQLEELKAKARAAKNFDLDALKNLGRNLMCMPLSRSITDVERAGEAILSLIAELEWARKDARRYQWLRKVDAKNLRRRIIDTTYLGTCLPETQRDLDEAIDAALSAQEGEGK